MERFLENIFYGYLNLLENPQPSDGGAACISLDGNA